MPTTRDSRRGLVIFLTTLLLLLCHLAVRADSRELRLVGSTTLLPVLRELTAEFRRSHPGMKLDVQGGGSGRGIEALRQGNAGIAASSRFLSTAEIALFQQRDTLPVPFHIAHDAIIPIVHKSNRVKSLSLAQLGQVYRGEVDNWGQIDGPNREIVAVIRDTDSGTFHVWQERVAGGESKPAEGLYADSSEAVVRHVAANRGAIGYIGLSNLNANVKPLRVDDVIGSLNNVRSGIYPLSRPLFLFTLGWPEGQVLDFIHFVQDPDAGQRVVEGAGLIPLYSQGRH